tara:strand:- start:154 stop:462 length:309 start_codon:yes stop_codon:yes gene_type:complete
VKRKTLARIHGTLYLGFCAIAGGYAYYCMTSESPTTFKVLSLIPAAISIPLAIDGAIDLVRGTHHYFGANVLKCVTKDQKERDELDSYIRSDLERREEPLQR